MPESLHCSLTDVPEAILAALWAMSCHIMITHKLVLAAGLHLPRGEVDQQQPGGAMSPLPAAGELHPGSARRRSQ